MGGGSVSSYNDILNEINALLESLAQDHKKLAIILANLTEMATDGAAEPVEPAHRQVARSAEAEPGER